MIVDPKPPVRCAIYTRKSIDRGDQTFDSLAAQRDACEAYIQSQRSAGWHGLPDHYDDGGYSGGSTDRPALQSLLTAIEAGHIDVVLVYRTDRLSRSLLDFSNLLAMLERHGISFVSVTEQFNTATPSGRLMLNMIASFAEYERALISERTRDKMRAARRKGKWTGGIPMLGYDVHPDGGRLIVNEAEATRAREIFALYGQLGSLSAVCRDLQDRGWARKQWRTRKGTVAGGTPFTKATLHRLLTNPIYTGRVRHQGALYDGDHDAIVDGATFDGVQEMLRRPRRRRTSHNGHSPLLAGLIHCAHCDCRMVHSTTRKAGRIYRYYVCGNAQRNGWKTCPAPSVPAGEVEGAVAGEVQRINGAAASWSAMTADERATLTTSLVDRIDWDGVAIDVRMQGDQ